MLNERQRSLLAAHPQGALSQTIETVEAIADRSQASNLVLDDLVEFLKICNLLYRHGEPLINDNLYDSVFLAELQKRQPNHPFLTTVEPEPAFAGKTVPLPQRMLSTEKAYTKEAIEKWLKTVEKSAASLGIDPESLIFRGTPKLDGFAAFDDGTTLYTRGDGRKGTDITRVFDRGLIVGGSGKRGLGAGEIVVSQTYFSEHLADTFDSARNFQASIIKEKVLEEPALKAIQNHAAVFFPFSELPDWHGNAGGLLANFDDIVADLLTKVDFDVDGVIFEVTDEQVKTNLGATRHHHRWQIAYKQNVQTAEVRVLQVIPNTSRSGRVNPVAELESTRLSGALISRATAHHYGMVKAHGIGPGTLIELTRSGQVIPKIERVLVPQTPQIPEQCPSCGTALVWDSDYLYCLNSGHCPAQIETAMEHFFRTLANNDGFGEKTIAKLHANGINSVFEIYQITLDRLIEMGFRSQDGKNLLAKNLLEQLQRSRTEAIEDWRFLGAFGIYRMGLGNCERLLQHHRLLNIFTLDLPAITEIEGFAEKTGQAVVKSLALIKDDFFKLYALGFNLIPTPLQTESKVVDSPISGKTLVFTGTMRHGSRDEMIKQAKTLGAKTGTSVTGKTDFLITGDDTGATKLTAAAKHGVKILTEIEYLALINNPPT
jgi:DNA ligase (NAD+)